jgi:hypothetical protein
VIANLILDAPAEAATLAGLAVAALVVFVVASRICRPRELPPVEPEYAWSGRALRVNNAPVQTRTRRRTDEH